MTPKREFSSRWGNAIADDYQWCQIPGYILRNYSKCVSYKDVRDDNGKIVTQCGEVVRVDMQDMMFVVHIMAFKYDSEGAKASPALQTIADYAGLSINSVRRIKQRLLDYGLLTIERIEGKPDVYNFSGLHEQCVRLESGLCPIEGVQVYTPPKSERGHKFGRGTSPKSERGGLQEMGDEELGIEKGKKKNNSDAVISSYIKAWLDGLPIPPATNQYANKTNRVIAKAISDAGYTTDQVTAYTRMLATDPYWRGKLVSFKYVGDGIAAAIGKATPPPSSAPPPPPQEAEQPRELTPDEAAARIAEYNRWMNLLLTSKVEKTVEAA